MKILALETSTERCSVALWIAGRVLEQVHTAVHTHAEVILPMVEALLAEAGVSLRQLDALAFGRGPGGFTGVRVATAVVQGLAFGAERPVVPVSDLMALAAGAHRLHAWEKILVCVDARMHEIYWCAYEATTPDRMTARAEEQLSAADAVATPDSGPWYGAGSGFAAYGVELTQRLGKTIAGQDAALLPTAEDIARLAVPLMAEGRAVSAEAALPVYLRDQVARVKTGL